MKPDFGEIRKNPKFPSKTSQIVLIGMSFQNFLLSGKPLINITGQQSLGNVHPVTGEFLVSTLNLLGSLGGDLFPRRSEQVAKNGKFFEGRLQTFPFLWV